MLTTTFIEEYKKLLNIKSKRRENGSKLNEDEMRYMFFYTLVKEFKLKPIEIDLEELHAGIDRAKIDMSVNYKGMKYCFEFKNHRKRKSDTGRSAEAGRIFSDFLKLNMLKSKTCKVYLVYLSDPEMIKYLENEKNGFSEFISLKEYKKYKIEKKFLDNKTKTFKKTIETTLDLTRKNLPFNIELKFIRPLTSGYELRVYQVIEK